MTWTSRLSEALINHLRDILTSVGFLSLGSSYNDPGWDSAGLNHTENACIEMPGQTKTVTFYGRSMMGIAPEQFAMLNNLMTVVAGGRADLPDAVLDIELREPSDNGPDANISADFANNGDTELSDSGLSSESWPTFVVSTNGTSVADLQDGAIPYCYMQFQPHSSKSFGPWEWNRTGLSSGNYVIMSCVVIWDYIVVNMTANSSWTPVVDDSAPDIEPKAHDNYVYVAIGGACIAIVGGVAAFYFVRTRRGI